MRLKPAMEKLKFDKRMIDLNLRNNVVSDSEYDTHKNSLQDLEGSYENISIEEGAAPANYQEEMNGHNNY